MNKKKYVATGEIDYIQGHLRRGHFELELTEEEYEKFILLSDKEQKEWLKEDGELVVDDFEANDVGEITTVEIEEV